MVLAVAGPFDTYGGNDEVKDEHATRASVNKIDDIWLKCYSIS